MTEMTVPISLSDIASSLSTADHLDSLLLTVQTAQQIVVADNQVPTRAQLQILPWRDIDALLTWWSLAQQRDAALSWTTFLTLVVQHIQTAQSEVVLLKLAYHPTLQQLDELTELIRARFSPTALLKVEYQPELVAGCVIELQGQRFDFSAETWLPHFIHPAPPATLSS